MKNEKQINVTNTNERMAPSKPERLLSQGMKVRHEQTQRGTEKNERMRVRRIALNREENDGKDFIL